MRKEDPIFKRPGFLEISMDLIRDNPKKIQDVLSKTLLVRATNNFIRNSILYQAYSEEFEEISPEEKIPVYRVMLINEIIKFERVEGDVSCW